MRNKKYRKMESTSKLKCKDAEFSCDKRLLNFSKALSSQPSLANKFSSQSFAKVLLYYSLYEFDSKNFPKQISSIESNKFNDSLNTKDLEVLKDCMINDSELRIYSLKELIELTYVLEFIELKNMLLTALATHFKCGLKEEELLNYKIQNSLEEKWILKDEDVKKFHKESIEKLNLQIQEALQS